MALRPLPSFQNPINIRADILMSIKPEYIHNISVGTKNHEYRKYLLPSTVKRIWFYTSAPTSAIQYVACIGRGRVPGQVPDDGGIGNADFNARKKVSKYGYPIKKLWKLTMPLSINYAKQKGYLKGPPQKYCWAPKQLLDDYPLQKMERVLGSTKGVLGKRQRFNQFKRLLIVMESTCDSKAFLVLDTVYHKFFVGSRCCFDVQKFDSNIAIVAFTNGRS